MKITYKKSIHVIRQVALSALICFGVQNTVFAQETATTPAEETPSITPVKNTFENSVMINNQTTQVNSKNELGFMIQHRFGVMKDGSDLYGVYAPANIRLGLNYGVTKKLSIGLGVTKSRMQYDLELKYKILNQSKGGGSPVNVTFYSNVARSEAASSSIKNQEGKLNENNRLTFFNELMVSRKIDNHLSVQASLYYAHVNIVDSATLTHDRLGFSFIGRYKFSPQSSVLLGYNQNLISFDKDWKSLTNAKDPLKPDLSIGYEVSTGSHQFQIFVATADGILNQDIRFFNQNDFFNKQILIGFNITRQWGF